MQRWTDQAAAPHRDLCTDCGVSRTSNPKRCATACQFIQPDYPAMEHKVHGRTRVLAQSDELFLALTSGCIEQPYDTRYRGLSGLGLQRGSPKDFLKKDSSMV